MYKEIVLTTAICLSLVALAAAPASFAAAPAIPTAFSVSGIGSVTCNNGQTQSGLQLSIPSVLNPVPVVRQNGLLQGSWSFSLPGPQIQGLGSFQGQSSMKGFFLLGSQNEDDVCGAGPVTSPGSVTISGLCGQGVTIFFTSTFPDPGENSRGTFTGNVVCV